MEAMPRTAYRTRPVRFLELWSEFDWRVKVYGIAAEGERPRSELVAAGKAMARRRLPRPATGDGRYGVAFLTLHQGVDGVWAILDWWANGNQLFHHVVEGALASPEDLRPVTGGLIACTWELSVTEFERRAWLAEVFAAEKPDLDRYLAARFDGDV